MMFFVLCFCCLYISINGYNTLTSKSVFSDTKTDANSLKLQILQAGASLDRGNSYNPTSGAYYEDRMIRAREKIEKLIKTNKSRKITLKDQDGEWELVFTTGLTLFESPHFTTTNTDFV